MEQIIFATHNKHKLEEVKKLLSDKFKILSLNDIGLHDEIPETGFTLKENASQKSHYLVQRFSQNCFADDTGLEVDALNGEPGVFSARYAGENATYEQNVKKLLAELKGIKNRKARFKTVISLIYNNKEYFFEGVVEGQILTEKKGTKGFGYDPVFVPNGYNQTFAEINTELKNKISHRGKAVQKLVRFLLSSSK